MIDSPDLFLYLATLSSEDAAHLAYAAALDAEYGDDIEREIADREREQGNEPSAWLGR